MNIMINALEYAKRLRDAGIDRDLAEAQAQALANVLDHAVEHRLATKDDLQKEVSRLDKKIDQLEIRLTNKMFVMTASTITLLGGLMTVLHFY